MPIAYSLILTSQVCPELSGQRGRRGLGETVNGCVDGPGEGLAIATSQCAFQFQARRRRQFRDGQRNRPRIRGDFGLGNRQGALVQMR